MKAYQLTAWESQPQMREVEVPEPGPGQVLLKRWEAVKVYPKGLDEPDDD